MLAPKEVLSVMRKF